MFMGVDGRYEPGMRRSVSMLSPSVDGGIFTE